MISLTLMEATWVIHWLVLTCCHSGGGNLEATWIIHWLVLTCCHSGGGNLDNTLACVDFLSQWWRQLG